VYGRYSGEGKHTIKLTGNVGGQQRTFEYAVTFPKTTTDDKSAFVPRLWAGQKVDFLLNEIRKSEKPDPELVDELTRLAKRYGIVTPYTSFLVADDTVIQRPLQLRKQLLGRLREGKSAAPSSQVQAAKDLSLSRRGRAKGNVADFDAQAEKQLKRFGRSESSLSAVRYVGSRTFYRQNNIWQESLFDPQKHKKLKVVKVGSDAYFKLLKKDARLAKFFALDNVVLSVNGKWVRTEGRKRTTQ